MNSNMGTESLMGMEPAIGMGSIMGKGSAMRIVFNRIDLLLKLLEGS